MHLSWCIQEEQGLAASDVYKRQPTSLDEAAFLDGATKWDTFWQITVPLSKPIITYTLLGAFMGPWVDFIFAKVIMGNDIEHYTIAIGLWVMLEKEYLSLIHISEPTRPY